MGRWIATGLLLVLGACASGSPMLDEAGAIEIARGELRARETWAEKAKYEATRTETGWSVLVWRVEGRSPEGRDLIQPGGHRVVRIDERGRVTDYHRGL